VLSAWNSGTRENWAITETGDRPPTFILKGADVANVTSSEASLNQRRWQLQTFSLGDVVSVVVVMGPILSPTCSLQVI